MGVRQTSLWLDEALYDGMRTIAFRTGRTIKSIVTEALTRYLEELYDDASKRRETNRIGSQDIKKKETTQIYERDEVQ